MNKKRYSIDDLGKFDGSKMTIKANGKQIYPQKRYVIVRVCTDTGIYRCPTNNGKCLYPKGVEVYCKKCAEINGDTKEQLIRKVAQVIERRFARNYRFGVLVDEIKNGLAKEIVEFLGVEE